MEGRDLLSDEQLKALFELLYLLLDLTGNQKEMPKIILPSKFHVYFESLPA